MCAHAEQRGPGLWDEVCSPKMQWWSLLALADLFVINRTHALANQLGIFKVIEQRCVCHPAHARASVSDAGSS